MVECTRQDQETSKVELIYKKKDCNWSILFIGCYRDDPREFAIKKFKPDREGDTHHYVGISQSACREIAVRQHIHTLYTFDSFSLVMSRTKAWECCGIRRSVIRR